MKKHPIIFVDDDELYLRLVESIVRQRGIRAYYATCGADALEVMRSHRCEAMVTDLNMPGMDGYLLAALARDLLPDLHIVMVTSDASGEVRRLASRSGVARVLEKPATVKQVQAVLEVAADGITAEPDPGATGTALGRL